MSLTKAGRDALFEFLHPRNHGKTLREIQEGKVQQMTIIGTNCFVNRKAANKYYTQYGFSVADVALKINRKAITIGKPKITKGQKLLIVDGGTRYAIQEGDV